MGHPEDALPFELRRAKLENHLTSILEAALVECGDDAAAAEASALSRRTARELLSLAERDAAQGGGESAPASSSALPPPPRAKKSSTPRGGVSPGGVSPAAARAAAEPTESFLESVERRKQEQRERMQLLRSDLNYERSKRLDETFAPCVDERSTAPRTSGGPAYLW